ncbi:MAG: hypothetical protein PHX18_08645 [Candidatus Gastranaerophilales bacterium]|nr:hypothetical protein [Candidatus Gastranaerophilales bacterium]
MNNTVKEQLDTEKNKSLGVLYKYAQTLVDVPGLGARTFSYLIPDALKEKIKPGIPVLVPFGAKRQITAFIDCRTEWTTR